jgi:branched-chain amino acid aminotransferase
MGNPEFIWLNGALVPFADARIHALSPAVKYGVGVFEGLRAYPSRDGRQLYVFRLEEHLARLAYSMRVMRFDDPPATDTLREAVLATLRANAIRGGCHIRLSVYLDGDGEMNATGPVGTFCAALPRPPETRVETGVTAGVVSWRRPEDSAMPMRVKAHANYHNGRLATLEARGNGHGTAIILNARGKVAEGPGMCLFIIRDGVAITPGVSSDILESITRDAVMRLLRDQLGVPVVERDVDRSELYLADEAFFCGTAWEVTPVTAIDRLAVGSGAPGAVTRALQLAYFAIVNGESNAHAAWRTPVYEGARAAS